MVAGAVEILCWPENAARREALARAGVPRILVLGAGTVPPPAIDDIEDWIWSPFDERDLVARSARLAGSTDDPDGLAAGDLSIDDEGVVRFAGRLVSLPQAEAEIVRTLSDPLGAVHSRTELERSIWGDAVRRPHSLDSRLFTLRRRLAAVGLTVSTVRGRGFVLDVR